MIKHIVMWNIKDEYDGLNKEALILKLKSELLALKNQIPEIQYFEVVINEINADRNFDIVLNSEFNSFDDLAAYASHPAHLGIGNFVKAITIGRAAVDYTMD